MQFQILLVMVALERNENISKRDARAAAGEAAGGTGAPAPPMFARKLVDPRTKPVAESLSDLLREIGISRVDDTLSVANLTIGSGGGGDAHQLKSATNTPHKPQQQHHHSAGSDHVVKHSGAGGGEPNLFSGTVIVPSSSQPENLHSSTLNHSRQAMMLRMEHLFDEVETRALQMTPTDSEVLALLSAPREGGEVVESKVRLPSKPVVIGDALPVPALCPDSVEQLLEASLAHHNLGAFEDSLKFLEAARIQLADIEHRTAEAEERSMALHGAGSSSNMMNAGSDKKQQQHSSERKLMYMDLDMYITLCKGNVYQSCGDDEQSLLHFMDGWAAAVHAQDRDWEVICLNSIGMLAYYNLRYDVALLCFHAVVNYRSSVSN